MIVSTSSRMLQLLNLFYKRRSAKEMFSVKRVSWLCPLFGDRCCIADCYSEITWFNDWHRHDVSAFSERVLNEARCFHSLHTFSCPAKDNYKQVTFPQFKPVGVDCFWKVSKSLSLTVAPRWESGGKKSTLSASQLLLTHHLLSVRLLFPDRRVVPQWDYIISQLQQMS